MRQDFRDQQRVQNQKTAGLAESCQQHREQIMRLISATVRDLVASTSNPCAGIVLCGAGNCLDVDLKELVKLFRKVHLVDIDDEAVLTAIQNAGVVDQCQMHAPADLAEPLLSLTTLDFRVAADNREHALEILQRLTSEQGVADVPEADVVVSLCVFSQIVDTVACLIPEDHPSFANTIKAVRMGHLRRLLSMLRPGGVAIFVSDVVSSAVAPELLDATAESLPELVRRLVSQGKFLSGTNPALMLADLNLLSRLPTGAESVHSLDPWLWQMPDRSCAVYALRIQKKLPASETEIEIQPE